MSDAGSRKMDGPPERSSTAREAIAGALREGVLTARDVSARVGLPEREVAEHLPHLERSLVHGRERLIIVPPECMKCGFVFEQRERHSRPSRCPKCKSERVSPPRFTIREV
jgi:predicted Zn-ribbon and HTH transcriptional regulator